MLKRFSFGRKEAVQILLVLAVAGAAAVLANALRPGRLPWPELSAESAPELVSAAGLRQHLRAGTAVFVDTRDPIVYAAGHVAGAVNIPITWDLKYYPRIFEWLSSGDFIIIYCDKRNCEESAAMFKLLLANGFERKRLRIFAPGWEELEGDAGVPKTY